MTLVQPAVRIAEIFGARLGGYITPSPYAAMLSEVIFRSFRVDVSAKIQSTTLCILAMKCYGLNASAAHCRQQVPRCSSPICCGDVRCRLLPAGTAASIVVLSVQRGWADTSARRSSRCKRRDLSGWRWRGFSWLDGWPSSADETLKHNP